MNRLVRNLVSIVVAAGVVLAPTAAGARDENVVYAVNRTDGSALVRASVDYRKVNNGKVEEENRAYAVAQCVGCRTLAAAFQLVLVTKPPTILAPQNEAVAVNNECDTCVTWASAKQIVVETGGKAELTKSGRDRLEGVENGLESLQEGMMDKSLEQLSAEIDFWFAEFLDVAQTEIERTDGGHNDARVIASR
ncbi:MAG: putative peptide zinc metalloprotease protein [Actinomycetota bacterium]|nr:putative peptide zinc metalloprotease protein [Actinomycetota bacterium]MEA2972164.1 putative peptide zinc metalloprotease protein [Actinomycetota bacterium]